MFKISSFCLHTGGRPLPRLERNQKNYKKSKKNKKKVFLKFCFQKIFAPGINLLKNFRGAESAALTHPGRYIINYIQLLKKLKLEAPLNIAPPASCLMDWAV